VTEPNAFIEELAKRITEEKNISNPEVYVIIQETTRELTETIDTFIDTLTKEKDHGTLLPLYTLLAKTEKKIRELKEKAGEKLKEIREEGKTR